MPVLQSDFRPPALLRNPHLQTVLPVLLRHPRRRCSAAETLDLPDGDCLQLEWTARGRDRLAILTHGLEGSSNGGYIRGLANALDDNGWDALAWNLRGCGTEPNRLPRFYHSGETGDLRTIIEHTAPRYSSIALIGFSLGGNITLKYAGEAPVHPKVIAAAGVSVPVDLASSARALDERAGNRLYLRRFMRTLVLKVEAKALRFPGAFDTTAIRDIRSFQEFDDRYTAPLHGFRDAADYWHQSSARQYLPGIRIPALLLNAEDDPFLAPESFPYAEAEASDTFAFEAPRHGGHVGFLDLMHGLEPWSDRRVVRFLATAADRG